MARTQTPTPKTEETPALTEAEARLLVGKRVYIEGNFAGGDYSYTGKVTAAHIEGKSSLELAGTGIGPGGIPNDKKGVLKIFVPLRSVLHCNEI